MRGTTLFLTTLSAFSAVLLPLATVPNPGLDARHLEQQWTIEAGAHHQIGGAAIAGRTIYRAGTDDTLGVPVGEIRKTDAVTGADLGPLVSAPGRIFTQLAVAGDTMVVKATSGLLGYGVDGSPKWQVDTPGDGGFTIAGSTVVAEGADRVTAFALATGAPLWSVQQDGDSGPAGPVVAGDTVLRADAAHLTALDLASGAVRWTAPGTGAEVLAVGEQAYTVGPGGVCAFALATGQRAWCTAGAVKHGVATTYDPAAPAGLPTGRVYAVGEGFVEALELATGAVDWRKSYDDGSALSTSYWQPVLAGGSLFVITYHFRPGQRHELRAYSAADGSLQRRLDLYLPYEVGGEPLLSTADRLYFASLAGIITFANGRVLA